MNYSNRQYLGKMQKWRRIGAIRKLAILLLCIFLCFFYEAVHDIIQGWILSLTKVGQLFENVAHFKQLLDEKDIEFAQSPSAYFNLSLQGNKDYSNTRSVTILLYDNSTSICSMTYDMINEICICMYYYGLSM